MAAVPGAPDAPHARFLTSAHPAIEALSRWYAGAPDEALEAALSRFGAALALEWRAVALPGITGAEIAAAVVDVVERIRAHRREIRSA